MSTVENVIEKQIDLMKLDLEIVLQKTKIAEYKARANVLHARVRLEQNKLNNMTERFRAHEQEN